MRAWTVSFTRLLARLVVGPVHCLVVTQEPNQRYVQVMLGHGHAHLEASSNAYLEGDFRLGESDNAPDSVDRHRAAPIERHAAADLIEPAWAMRHDVRITDGVSLALAAALDTRVVTTDQALARAAPDRTRLAEQPDNDAIFQRSRERVRVTGEGLTSDQILDLLAADRSERHPE